MKIKKENIGHLRQFLNEDYIAEGKYITNGMIAYWLTGKKRFLKEHEEEMENREEILKELEKNNEKQIKM